jgi:hypothetical protein
LKVAIRERVVKTTLIVASVLLVACNVTKTASDKKKLAIRYLE